MAIRKAEYRFRNGNVWDTLYFKTSGDQIENLYEFINRTALQNIITGAQISLDSYLIRDIVTGECRMRLYTPGQVIQNQGFIGTLPARFRPQAASAAGWTYQNFEVGAILPSYGWMFTDLKVYLDGRIQCSHPANELNSTMFADIKWLATKG